MSVETVYTVQRLIGCDVLFSFSSEVPDTIVTAQYGCTSQTASGTFQKYITKYYNWQEATKCMSRVLSHSMPYPGIQKIILFMLMSSE